MLPIVPLLLILPANFIMELKQIKVNKLIKRIVLFLFFLLIFASIPETIVSIHANKSLLCYSNIINSAKYVSGTNGSVIAPNWPLIAYYGNVKAIPFTYEPEDFDWYVSYHNVSYVIVSLDKKVLESFGSSAGEKTSYVINKSFFDNKKYLVMEKEFNDECGIYLIYGVRNWTY
jgi:quinol-cytochrome oxidoreductase complex cytochrome b subunit